jgi:hypothetical protein
VRETNLPGGRRQGLSHFPGNNCEDAGFPREAFDQAEDKQSWF